jgi:tetratricopeptide (TPR) repeat protein
MTAGVVAILFAAGSAVADPIGDLEKAYGAYAAHKFSDAEARLRALLDGRTNALKDPDSIADAQMYLGAVLVAEGKRDEASEVFEKLLKEKPDYEPDKLRVQLDAIDAFIDVHTRLRAELGRIQAEHVQGEQAAKAKAEALRQRAALRVAMLERMASEERVVDYNSRWLALVPFGVGQFQNGQRDLGLVFLSSEVLLAVGSAVAGVVSVYDQLQRNEAEARNDGTAATYNGNAKDAAYVNDALAGGFALTAIIGAVHAELTFVPKIVSVRKRAVPTPALAPVAGPGWLGVTGRF